MDAHEQEPLEKMIEQAIGGGHAELDFDAWQEKHQTQIRLFQTQCDTGRPARSRRSLPGWAVATAATLVIGIGLLIWQFLPQPSTPPQLRIAAAKTPGEMMSLIHLNAAFRSGGLEAVEDQYEEAYARLGPRLGLELGDLFENGS